MKKRTKEYLKLIGFGLLVFTAFAGILTVLRICYFQHGMYDIHCNPSWLVGFISEEPRSLAWCYQQFTNHSNSDVLKELNEQVLDGVLHAWTDNIGMMWYEITDYGKQQLDKWGRLA